MAQSDALGEAGPRGPGWTPGEGEPGEMKCGVFWWLSPYCDLLPSRMGVTPPVPPIRSSLHAVQLQPGEEENRSAQSDSFLGDAPLGLLSPRGPCPLTRGCLLDHLSPGPLCHPRNQAIAGLTSPDFQITSPLQGSGALPWNLSCCSPPPASLCLVLCGPDKTWELIIKPGAALYYPRDYR